GPPIGDADDLARWDRRGVAQAGFSHYFLARSTRIVREEAPDLLEDLEQVGITPSAVRFGEGFEDDRALTARRPVYEAVLRRFTEREPRVELVTSSVRGLLTAPSDPHRIVGLRLDSDEEVGADLVVDAGGRRSATGRWLRDLGLDEPAVTEEPVNRHYYCRHYRLRPGEDYPTDDVPIVQPLPYGTVLVFIGDNRTYSVAFELSADDPLKEHVQDAAVFDRFLHALPMTAPWMDRSEPASDLRVMAGLSNRRRRLVVDERPIASGMALVGDASQYTNPALGQGVSLTFWMAQRLADLVERVHDDPTGTARAYEDWVDEELGPRFERQLRADREANRQLAAGLAGEGFIPPAEEATHFARALFALAQEDEELMNRARRVGHLLERPSSLQEDPSVVRRVQAMSDHGPPLLSGHGPLPREQFETLVA
ncbi:MAG: hypothetical protein R3320_10950, partial [Nitriliruptorales bacterium]|nr:hypothetical protein [Nitriliruptorales bacterium]